MIDRVESAVERVDGVSFDNTKTIINISFHTHCNIENDVSQCVSGKMNGVYSPEPRAEVYCFSLNFNISKLVYCELDQESIILADSICLCN